MNYKVGERVSMIPQTFGTGVDKPGEGMGHTKNELKREIRPLAGTVTFVHPRGRWYQVTFDIGIRECFFYDVEPTPKARVPMNRSRLYGGTEWQN